MKLASLLSLVVKENHGVEATHSLASHHFSGLLRQLLLADISGTWQLITSKKEPIEMMTPPKMLFLAGVSMTEACITTF